VDTQFGVDDPRFLATTIGTWLNSWRTAAPPTRSYADAPKSSCDREYTFSKHCARATRLRGDRIGPTWGRTARPTARGYAVHQRARRDARLWNPTRRPRASTSRRSCRGLASNKPTSRSFSNTSTRNRRAHPAAATRAVADGAPRRTVGGMDRTSDPAGAEPRDGDGVRERARESRSGEGARTDARPFAWLRRRSIVRWRSPPFARRLGRSAMHSSVREGNATRARRRREGGYCPMVASTAPAGRDDSDPYYGQQMSDCGRSC